MEIVAAIFAFVGESALGLIELVGSLAVWWWHPSDADSPKPTKPWAKKKG